MSCVRTERRCAVRAAIALYRELRDHAGVEGLQRRSDAEEAAVDFLDSVARGLGNPDALPKPG